MGNLLLGQPMDYKKNFKDFKEKIFKKFGNFKKKSLKKM